MRLNPSSGTSDAAWAVWETDSYGLLSWLVSCGEEVCPTPNITTTSHHDPEKVRKPEPTGLSSCPELTWPSQTAPSTSASCLPSCRRTESPAFLGGESSRSHRTTVGTEACWKLACLCRRQGQLAWFWTLPGVHKFTSTVCGCVCLCLV